MQELGFDRDVQAVVHGVVEFPEADDAGELDDLRRRQMLLEPLENLVGHAIGRFRGGAHVIEADPLELVLRVGIADDHLLQLLSLMPQPSAALTGEFFSIEQLCAVQ